MCAHMTSVTVMSNAKFFSGINITLQGFADDVFEGAYNITTDAQSGLGIFDNITAILNVDVNVTGMNTEVQVSIRLLHCNKHM